MQTHFCWIRRKQKLKKKGTEKETKRPIRKQNTFFFSGNTHLFHIYPRPETFPAKLSFKGGVELSALKIQTKKTVFHRLKKVVP